jgi:hypothetical protein
MKRILAILILLGSATLSFAGNPDRRGEAGAYELLMNGYARSSGFWAQNTAGIRGLESERLNVAGLAFTKKTEIIAAYTLWLQGSGVGIAQVGVAQNVKANTFALTFNALNLGAIEKTTTENPEGGLGTYRPTFINIGLSYARQFSNSISGGVTLRMINESLENINAFGFCVDAGLQYVTGPKDNIHFGVSLRNVGTPMRFRGDALSTSVQIVSSNTYQLTTEKRSNKFELPTQLNIGAAYDFWAGKKKEIEPGKYRQDYRVTALANFASNAFGADQYGLGVEFGWKEMLMLRAGYRFEKGIFKKETSYNVYNGFAAGFTFDTPLKKDKDATTRLGIDYSFRMTNMFAGTHSIGLRFNL